MNSLINQFLQLPIDLTQKDYITATNSDNIWKNNFQIYSSEESRVKLSNNRYINANWIYNHYIATQYPYESTQTDFWNMIYETKASVIINLHNINYISSKISEHPTLTIYIINSKNIQNIQINTIIINDHICHHIFYGNWSDGGIPSFDEFNDILKITRLYQTNNPIVVHCKAGIGRTGTFITIHKALELLQLNIEPDIIEIIKDLRKCRAFMVQNANQLSFIADYIQRVTDDILIMKLNIAAIKSLN